MRVWGVVCELMYCADEIEIERVSERASERKGGETEQAGPGVGSKVQARN